MTDAEIDTETDCLHARQTHRSFTIYVQVNALRVAQTTLPPIIVVANAIYADQGRQGKTVGAPIHTK